MDEIIKLINDANSIAVAAHEGEDADAVGSCLAMKQALMQKGKKVKCYFSAGLTDHLSFIGDDYSVYKEPNDEVYDLFICLDCGSIDRLGDREALFERAKRNLSIDHHETNTEFAEVNYVDPKASATGEILYDFFKKLGTEMNKDIARYLYIAISADTGSFKYSNVQPKTMRIAADLIAYDIDHADIALKLYGIEDLKILKFKAELMQNIEQYDDGKITIVVADKKMLKKHDIEERDCSNIVDISRGVKGTEIALSLREAEDKIKISLRSLGDISVSAIAEKFGGGGHKKAAGASQKGKTLEEVKAEIIRVCEEALNG